MIALGHETGELRKRNSVGLPTLTVKRPSNGPEIPLTVTPDNMPEQTSDPVETNAAVPETESRGYVSSILSKISVVLILAAVVMIECAVAYVILPDVSETAAMTGAVIPADSDSEENNSPVDPFEEGAEPEELVEVDLGQFSITAFQPLSNSTIRLDFHLYGTVGSEHAEQFQAAMEDNKHRFRDQVIVTMRSSELTELTDAQLGLIKRKVLEKTNRTLGKPLLRTIIFSDFSFIEQ